MRVLHFSDLFLTTVGRAHDRRHLQHLRNACAIPAIDQVLRLHARCDHVGVERGEAFAALLAGAVVDETVGVGRAQLLGETIEAEWARTSPQLCENPAKYTVAGIVMGDSQG